MAPYILFALGVVFASWLGGRGPGLVAALLSAPVANYFFTNQPSRFTLAGPVLIATVIALVADIAIALLCGSLRELFTEADEKATLALSAAAQQEKAEVASLHSQIRLREQAELLENAPVLVRNLRDEISLWTRGMERLYGWSRDEAGGKVVHSLLRTRFSQRHSAIMEVLRRDGRWEGELRHRCKDGDERVVASLWVLHRDERGNPAAIIEVDSDITGRKRAEEAVRLSGEQYRRLFETMLQGVVYQGADGRIISMNRAAERILGKTREELLGQTSLSVEHDTIREDGSPFPGSEHPAMVALRTGKEVVDVVMGVHNPREGGFRWIRISAVPLFTQGASAPHQAYTLFDDITERKRLQETLQELLEDQHRLALDSANMGTWRYEVATQELRWDERSARLFGLGSAGSGYGRARKSIHPDDRLRAERAVKDALDPVSGGRLEVEYRVVWPDSSVHWVTAKGRAHFDGDGAQQTAVRLLGTLMETTEQKRAEEELRQADRRKTEFLAMLSHELRNPLTPIRASVFLLGKNASLDAGGQRAAGVIDRQVTHLARLIDDLLDVTRISRGKVRLRRARVDLADVVRRVLEDHRCALGRHALAVTMPEERLWIDADSARIAQVVDNLLNNATKFTPDGGSIGVSLARDGTDAVFEVADTGIGIDGETLGKLFEPFSQAERTLDRSRGGLGLGLALVKGMVGLHGGTVRALSDGPGHGARFIVTLPLREQGAALESPPPTAVPTAASGPAKAILVIEDNRDTAESLREILELSGHRVVLATDGTQGLAKAHDMQPEVVLCDIGLPGLDGYGVARALKGDDATASAKLIAMTGYAQPEDQRLALDAGFDLHIAKPLDPSGLEQLLASLPSRVDSSQRPSTSRPGG